MPLAPKMSKWQFPAAAAAARSLQSCLTLCNPIDGSPPGSSIPGILQARTLEWVAISFSNAWKWKVKVKSLSRVWLFPTPWTAAHQAPPSMGFSRQEYWSGVPLPSLGNSLEPVNMLLYMANGTKWLHFVVQSLSRVQLFVTPWTAACQASLSFTISWSLLIFMSPESVRLSTISSSATLFSFCLQSFPASGFFPVNQLLASGGQGIGASASASVLPMNIQG